MGRNKKKAKTTPNSKFPPKPSTPNAKAKRREEWRIQLEIKKKEEEEDLTNSAKKTKSFTNKQCKEMFGRTTSVRIPDDCVFNFFELAQKLGLKNDGDTIAWLMDQAQLAMDKVPANSQQVSKNQIQNDVTPIKNTDSTSCDSDDPSQLWKKILVNQVWALWDDDADGMPRLYARIHKLLFDEMKVEVAFLEPVPTTDEEVTWLADRPMACGTFKEATSTTLMEILEFSHQVICGKGSSVAKSCYKISPRKGEIWAVYKDWSINWTLHDFSHCRYELVEVVSDLEDESAITTINLTRIGGVGDAFRRQVHGRDGLVMWQQFSGTKLLPFSHRILASKLKVQEMDGVPVESWKLNPSAVPLQCRSGRAS